MPNLYGIANPNPAWVFAQLIGGADVPCPVATETNVIALLLNPIALPGNYIVVASISLVMQVGGTPITFLQTGIRIGSGSDLSQTSWNLINTAANSFGTYNAYVPCAGSPIQNPQGPTTINISLNPTGGAVTAKLTGSFAFARWEFAPP